MQHLKASVLLIQIVFHMRILYHVMINDFFHIYLQTFFSLFTFWILTYYDTYVITFLNLIGNF